jgi:cysteine-rich repeat protein
LATAVLTLLGALTWPGLLSAAESGLTTSVMPGTVGAGGVTTVVVDPQTPTTLYAGTWCSMVKSLDGGSSWMPANIGLPVYWTTALAIDPQTTTTLYAGTNGGAVYKSTDGASTWRPSGTGLPVNITALAIDPVQPTTLYVVADNYGGASAGVYKSIDGGATWNATSLSLYYGVPAFGLAPSNPATLYAIAYGAGTVRSTDGGDTWTTTRGGEFYIYISNWFGNAVEALAVDPVVATTLYVATHDGVYKSTDAGDSWSKGTNAPTGPFLNTLAIDPLNPSILYATADNCTGLYPCNSVYKSTDGAAVLAGSGPINTQGFALAIDPVTPTMLYAAFAPGYSGAPRDLYKSADGAASWNVTTLVGAVTCGDGYALCGEQCDDGNLIDGDGCDSNCRPTGCGNGIVTAGEQCDDGNLVDGDGCDSNCTRSGCGNGIVTAGEECDDGNRVDGDGCDFNCTVTRCSNGIVTAGEECDDGNLNPFDGCSAQCILCGNGIVTPPEECDDGNTSPSDGCTNACTICGNGVVTVPESCDDGNRINGDGCEDYCAQPGCGNTVVEGDEECDDGGICIGNANAGTYCSADTQCPGGTCKTFGGDGCAANCTLESDVPFDLVPGHPSGPSLYSLVPGTSGGVIYTDSVILPLPVSGSQMLTIGKERDGQIAVVVRAATARIAYVQDRGEPFPWCLRAVAAKTCGGTVFEADGSTPSTDCTPGYTASDSACAGKKACAFVHGPGNSASGVIGCTGLDGVNISMTQDDGSSNNQPGPITIVSSGTGGAGSSLMFESTAIGLGSCADRTQDLKLFTVPVTTSTASGQVVNFGGSEGYAIGPFTVTGHPFECNALRSGSASGAALASVFIGVASSWVPDSVMPTLFVAQSPCVGDCNADRHVTIEEILKGVNIALGRAQLADCTAFDRDHDTTVTIDEIIAAVNEALSGCGS